MDKLKKHNFDAVSCRKEWNEFDNLLKTNLILEERKDVLPFFKDRPHLSTLIGNQYIASKTVKVDVFAHEFKIYNNFIADLIVGDSTKREYVLIEFEDGKPNSIFDNRQRNVPNWATRFEKGFSQLVDWMWKLDDMKTTNDFENNFGSRDAKFYGLIIIGKNMNLEQQEIKRLKWRLNNVVINSRHISCVSFDELKDDLDFNLKTYHHI